VQVHGGHGPAPKADQGDPKPSRRADPDQSLPTISTSRRERGLGAGMRRPTGRSSPSSSSPCSGALPPPGAPWLGRGPSSANPAP